MLRSTIREADVILCTLLSAHNEGLLRHAPEDHFGLTVIDECSQVVIRYCRGTTELFAEIGRSVLVVLVVLLHFLHCSGVFHFKKSIDERSYISFKVTKT